MKWRNPIPYVQEAKHAGKLRFSAHGLERAIERDIKPSDVKQALNCETVTVLENFPTGPKPTCLILGRDDSARAIHTIVAYPNILVVTVYEPKPPYWVTSDQRGNQI